MSLMNFIGPRPNLLDPKSGKNQKLIEVDHPILDNLDIEKIRNIDKFTSNKLRSVTLSICYNKKENPNLEIENFFTKHL
jgi:glutamate synthase (NADPH/NADH) large chain